MLTRADIARLVPHAGAMCLLERVLAWDAAGIRCEAESHADAGNPLRRDGLLPAACGLEYALQAMALHGALSAGNAPQRPGFVSSLRDVVLGAARLDDVPGPLSVAARALIAEERGFVYAFEVTGQGRVLLAGQAAVILPEAAA